MSIRLKITGGFGGPAAWQDLVLDPNQIEPEKLKRMESSLEAVAKRAADASSAERAVFPDAQTYEFEFGKDNKTSVTVSDANITPELREIVNVIRKQSKDRANDKQND